MVPNALGVLGVGLALDRGMKAVWANSAVVALGVALGFAVFRGLAEGPAAAFLLVSLMQLVIGCGMGLAVLPCTRIYSSLERSTGWVLGRLHCLPAAPRGRLAKGSSWRVACRCRCRWPCCSCSLRLCHSRSAQPMPPVCAARFAFGYNVGYGVLGGLAPLVITSIESRCPDHLKAYAPAFWLLAQGALSAVGILGLLKYKPRLNMPHVAKIM